MKCIKSAVDILSLNEQTLPSGKKYCDKIRKTLGSIRTASTSRIRSARGYLNSVRHKYLCVDTLARTLDVELNRRKKFLTKNKDKLRQKTYFRG